MEDRLAMTALPAGFTETLVTTGSNLSGPTAMEFSPVGELWVLEQGGAVKVVNGGSTSTALTQTVDSSGERGMLGIAFDPTYDGPGPNTDYVYLYYTVPRASNTDPSNNRLTRFTVTGAGGSGPTLGSPLVLRDLPPEDEDNNLATDGDTNHNGGATHFGLDGKLYVAVGDHNYDNPVLADDVAQTLTTPFGKMLRLNVDGTNPTDNPFYDGSASDWAGAIWARGLRNPFTFAFQNGTGKMFINDVGESSWEEINLGQSGVNYGWSGSNSPVYEGFRTSNPPPWTNYRDPQMAYDHSDSMPSPAGIAITGGTFIGTSFGSAYAGKYLFSDVGGNFIRLFDPAIPGTQGTPDTSTDFAGGLTGAAPVDLKFDSAGNLYYLSRGGATGEVYRISLTASVVGRQLFYNQSAFDGNNAAINASDDSAIATDKTAYLPNGTAATFNNVSSYSEGINGTIVDLLGSGSHAAITAADFIFKAGSNNAPSSWSAAPAPTSISVRTGAGVSGSDRVEIIWGANAVKNQWLEVQVLATVNTGLTASNVFFWGSKLGDTGAPSATDFSTTVAGDGGTIIAGLGAAGGITNVRDIDRTNSVTVAGDRGIAIANLGTLNRLLVAVNGPFAPVAEGQPAVEPAVLTGGAGEDDAESDSGVASALPRAASALGSSSSATATTWLAEWTRRLEHNRSPSATFFEHLADGEDSQSDAQCAEIEGSDDAEVEDELLAALLGALKPV